MTAEEMMIQDLQDRIIFDSFRKEFENAHHALNTALHYLEETGEFESSVLDEIYDDIYSTKMRLEKLLEK